MAHKGSCMYDKTHSLQIFSKNGYNDTRNININIVELSDCIVIKVRDIADFVFNYTANVDMRRFESMRMDQCLDINFEEFKSNLIDMLQQIHRQEMYLKCETEMNKCKLVFYGKSRIKSIIFLMIELDMTNQKEIFDEMNGTIIELQSLNRNLNSQLQISRKILQDKEHEIRSNMSINKQLERRFMNDLQNIAYIFNTKLQECSGQLLGKILLLTQKLLKLLHDVETVKAESLLKSNSSARLLQSMENLRIESLETSKIIEELRKENCKLRTSQCNSEKMIAELHQNVVEKESEFQALRQEKEVLEKDVKQATLIVAQKTAANDELARDLVQANQMLVNFNHIYETKNKEIEELQNSASAKDRIIQEQNQRLQNIYSEFGEYKTQFNEDEYNRLKHELFSANKKIEEVEKLNRETIKLNELLTRKLSTGDFTHQQPLRHIR